MTDARHPLDGLITLLLEGKALASPHGPIGGEDHLHFRVLETLANCKIEPAIGEAAPGDRFQLERLGYFCVDTKDSTGERPVLNRTVTLRDSWAKAQKGGK